MSSPIVSKIPSGIQEIDRLWSGLYRGGTYLVYGRTADGRSILPLMFADEGCSNDETCLFIATDRPRSLVIHASLIGFDIKDANKNNLLKLVRFPTLSESRGISDDARAETLAQLIELVRKNAPSRLVINDLTPFVQFESSDRFRREMVTLLDGLDELNVTSLIALPEPANVHSQRVISFLKSQVVGSLHVEKTEEDDSYLLSLIPNVGHITQEHQTRWNLAELVGSTSGLDSKKPTAAPGVVDSASTSETSFDADTVAKAITRSGESDVENDHDTSTDQFIEHVPIGDEDLNLTASAHDNTTKTTEATADPTNVYEPNQKDATYDEHIIDELNKELEGLVQPYEIVSSESQGGPIMPEVHSSRDSFSEASNFHFDNFANDQQPFLLIGMRLDRTPSMIPRKFDFEFVSELTQQLLQSYDLVLVDEERQNMVVLLANSTQDSADKFFRSLRAKMLEEAPKQATNLMRSVSAIVALNGDGFKSAEEFLEYVGTTN